MPEVTIVAHHVGGVRGGMERQLAALIDGLLARGFGVTVVARACVLPAHPRLRWIRVRVPRGPFALQFAWFACAGSVAVARHRRGALHTTGAIVVNRADVSNVQFCHHAYNAEHPPLAPWRRLAAWAERWAYRPRVTRTLVAASDGIAAELGRWFPRAAVVVIPNGVDTARFRPDPAARHRFRAEHAIPEGALVAAFVGGDWERKGLRHAIDAVARSPAWRLVVAGKGRPAPHERVHFLGPVPDPETVLAAADAFVLPSAYEAMSLVVLEAAACGLPLLVADVSGIAGVVVDGETGFAIERDGDAIAERLAALEDPELRARMGAAARRHAETLDWGAVVDAYARVYRG